MKAAIYTRVSTEDQAKEGVSLQNQLLKCRLQCKAKDFQIIGEYSDDGISAKDLKRPGIEAVLRLIKSRAINAVVIYKQDRLTRDVSDLNTFIKACNKHQIELIPVEGIIDINTAGGRATTNMIGVFSQFEREVNGERTKAALQYKKMNGLQYTRIPPYGFYHLNGALVQKPFEQEVIEKIVSYRKHLSWQKIADRLNNEEISAKMGGLWTKKVVWAIYQANLESFKIKSLAA